MPPKTLPTEPLPDSGRAITRVPPLSPVVKDWVRSFAMHVMTGVFAVLAHYSVMLVLVQLGTTPLLASALGFSAGAATRYLLSYYRVFSPTDGISVTAVRFAAALGAQLIANVLLLDICIKAGLGLWSAQVTTTVLLTFANFLAYRLWVFR